MNKPKLIFIGRAYHSKTKSDALILEVLEKRYDVEIIRRDHVEDKEIVARVNQERPVAVFFWCLPPSFTYHLLKFKCKNIIWAPMWDGFKKLSWKKKLIFRFFNVKVLCFSQVLYDYFQTTGLKIQRAQCFLKPKLIPQSKTQGPYTFFLWQRDPDIGIDAVVKMVGQDNIAKIFYKTEIGDQPHQKYAFEIQKLKDWLPKEEYTELLKTVDFFVAPRKAEGIGFSFLEPMSLGIPIIAYDSATMNEYVVNGENGVLFDDAFCLHQALVSPKKLSERLKQHAENFYARWEEEKKQIVPFIEG